MDLKSAYQLTQSKQALLVDVREADELRESGTAAGAVWMPTSKIGECHPDWEAFKKALPKDKQIFFFCRSGARSGRVAGMLAAEGYQTVNLGGFSAWKEAQLPTMAFQP